MSAPPFDVPSEAEVGKLRDQDPHNIVWANMPQPGKDRYDVAAFRLREWQAEAALERDEVAGLTIYRMSWVDDDAQSHVINAVVGALEVADAGDGTVLPHETNQPKPTKDRLNLLRATATEMSPVWALSPAAGLAEALRRPGQPVGRVEVDGVVHSLERVVEPERIKRISKLIGRDAVVLADGHDRYTAARKYRDLVRKSIKNKALKTSTDAELTMAFVSPWDDQLSVGAVHRLYDGVSFSALQRHLSGSFTFEPLGGKPTAATLTQMVDDDRLVLVDQAGNGTWLVPRPGAFIGVRKLDASVLAHALAGSSAQVSYQPSLARVLAEVAKHKAAILTRAVTLNQVRKAAKSKQLMEPHSTFFAPKPLAGLVLRPTAKMSQK